MAKITEENRGKPGYLPSWTRECGGNPSLNDLLDLIDANSQPRTSVVVGKGSLQKYADYFCDGTVEDSAKIQEAVTYVSSLGGGEVIILPNTYNIADTITLSNNVTISGRTQDAVLYLKNGVNKPILKNANTSTGNSKIKIRNLTLDGNRTNQTSFTGGLIELIQGGDNARHLVEDCIVKNSKFKGIYWQQANYVLVRNNVVDNCGANGIDGFVVTNSKVLGNEVKNITEYVAIIINRNSQFNEISGNIIDGISDDGIQLRGYSSGTEYTEYNIVSNNIIRNTGKVIGGQGVFINESGSRRNLIEGNKIYRSRVNGIEVTVNATEITIIGNTIIDSGYQGGEQVDALGEGAGINCNTNGARHIVADNRVIGSWRSGIVVGDNCIVHGNQVHDNGVKGSGSQVGISFGSNCSVMNNRCIDTRTGASRTQAYGYQSAGAENVILGNFSDNHITADYDITGSNRIFFNDKTSTFTGKSGTVNFASAVDARGFNVNGLKLQAVDSAGSLGGYLTRESADVFASYMNRATTSANDVWRWYVKNDSGVSTKTGGITGGTDSHLYYQKILTDNLLVNNLKLQDKLVITVGFDAGCDYVCDGVADDVQIKLALTAVATAGGGVIRIKKGTYDITSICPLRSNLVIEGAGANQTILRVGNGANTSVFINNERSTGGNSYITVRNMTIDGNLVNQSAGGTDGALIWFENVSHFWIQNVVSKNGKSFPIGGRNCTYGFINNNIASGSRDQDGISYYGVCNYLIITENIVHENLQGGIEIDGDDSPGTEPYFCVVADNVVYSNGESGINIDKQQAVPGVPPTYSANRCIVANNISIANTSYGIELPIDVENVICTGNISGLNGVDGIIIHSGDNHIIHGNMCYDNVNTGIHLTFSGSEDVNNCIVSTNQCSNYLTTNQDTGILIEKAFRTTVTSNSCYNNTRFGIRLTFAAKHNTITANVCYNNTEHGIDLTNADHNIILGNIVRANKQHGIRLNSAQYNIVSNNHVSNSSQTTTNTYNNIYITSDFATYSRYSDRNHINNNMCFDDSSKVKYGICIDASNTKNKIFGNTSLGSVTDNLFDAGTSTIIDHNDTIA